MTEFSELGTESESVLHCLPNGVALVSADLTIQWANGCLRRWFPDANLVGSNFYSAIGNPDYIGADACPLNTALQTNIPRSGTIQVGSGKYFQIHASKLADEIASSRLVVTVTDVTEEILQQQKIAAIHQAGNRLTDLKPDEIFAMDVEQRIELLKDNIRHYTEDLMDIEVIEIRLLSQATGNLIPLLSVGIDQAASDRRLMASPLGNGVTGYVAASGKSYLCRDTANDPLYLEAFKGARSSLTVPIMLHDSLIGTINVESPRVGAFNESDQQFLEIFARDIAVALNTLELLVAQQTNAALQSCEAIHAAVALPIDDILLDTVNVMEKYIGHDPDVVNRLQGILRKAREIKRSIHSIGQTLGPTESIPLGCNSEQHQKFRGRRILVVDADVQVRNDAHALFERYGCIVETAHEGDEAVLMVRNSAHEDKYDVIIADIKLPDYSGYQLMLRLQNILPRVPMVLMTGYGYDPGHSIVKARQAGLHPKGILFKPFRVEQLVAVTETILDDFQNPAA
ncbi:MAG: response regulator [Planctomycetota bacterium]|nr:response regulator [Planctomycetota bacterium]